MDFHLFFCCRNVVQLSDMLSQEELAVIKPLWLVRHMSPFIEDSRYGAITDACQEYAYVKKR